MAGQDVDVVRLPREERLPHVQRFADSVLERIKEVIPVTSKGQEKTSSKVPFVGCKKSAESSDDFTRLTNLGKSQLEQGDAALSFYRKT